MHQRISHRCARMGNRPSPSPQHCHRVPHSFAIALTGALGLSHLLSLLRCTTFAAPSTAAASPQIRAYRCHQTLRHRPFLHRRRSCRYAVALKLPTTATRGRCLDGSQEARQARRELGIAVGSAAGTNFKVRAVTAQLVGEVGSVQVAHTLRVGFLERAAKQARKEILAFRDATHGHEHARAAWQRA